jgi:hypothetical protein
MHRRKVLARCGAIDPARGEAAHGPEASRQRGEEKMIRIKVAALATVLLFGAVIAASPAADTSGGAPRIAFFGFQLINTSLETDTTSEDRRLRMLDALFRDKLAASERFKILPIPPEMQAAIAVGPEISNCNGCELDYARKLGAEGAAWGTVQKVSNLILNINLYIKDVSSGELTFVRSVDIRGNTDESWRHGLDYMLRHYLLGEP